MSRDGWHAPTRPLLSSFCSCRGTAMIRTTFMAGCALLLCAVALSPSRPAAAADERDGGAITDTPGLHIHWEKDVLTISGDIPGKMIRIWYLEAYCRPG